MHGRLDVTKRIIGRCRPPHLSAASAGKIAFQPLTHYDINAALIKREGKST